MSKIIFVKTNGDEQVDSVTLSEDTELSLDGKTFVVDKITGDEADTLTVFIKADDTEAPSGDTSTPASTAARFRPANGFVNSKV